MGLGKFSNILQLKLTHALVKISVHESPHITEMDMLKFFKAKKNMLSFSYERIYFEFPTKDLDLELIAQCAHYTRLRTFWPSHQVLYVS